MAKAKVNRILNKPQRLVVVELLDVVPRRDPNYPNVIVKKVSQTTKSDETLVKTWNRSRQKFAGSFVRIRDDLSSPTFYIDTDSRTAARDKLCASLSKSGYTVNPQLESKFSIYVVKLKRSAWTKDERVPVYVGESSYEPVERITHHLGGVHSARKVRNHFDGRWEALEPKNLQLHSRYDAVAEETKWGLKLLQDGYKVFGPQGLPKDR